jgi:hypothetical protein
MKLMKTSVNAFMMMSVTNYEWKFNSRERSESRHLFTIVFLLSAEQIHQLQVTSVYRPEQKVKGVPLHAMGAHGGRGGITPIHT